MAVAPTQRLSYGALASAIGGALLIISLFLHWLSQGPFSVTGWEFFSIDDIVLFAIGVGAILLGLMELPAFNLNLPFSRVRALTVLGTVATTLVWAILIESDHLAFGFFLAGISSIAILVGGVLAERSPEMGIALGGRAAAVAQGGPAAFQQPGGYGQQPGGYGQQPGGYGQQPGGYGQQQAAPAPVATPPTEQQPVPAQGPPPPNRPGQPADWYADPTGQKRLRYWDGNKWTEHVAD